MKKALLPIVILLGIIGICKAQNKELELKPIKITSGQSDKQNQIKSPVYFILCGNGSCMAKDLLHDFIIEEYHNQTAKEIYNNILMVVTSMYKSPKDVINKVENKMITVDGFIEYAGIRKAQYKDRKVSISYRLQFDFKDGKMSIKAPVIIDAYEEDKNIGDFPFYMKEVLWGIADDTVQEIQKKLNNVISLIIFQSRTIKNDW
ncbi:DUF4468 domain-containing protein [Bacteroides faecis]|uniref:DUF4468 domain-containing protein n=1 Tax=Bacteroides faecis TaxID=674529 RepID=UPI0012313D3A|nr:DUF4468 domain-containing protein [Bacteroides faecis]KAA5262286.1 DUF4468 domain-containing protein [Bacteroides faecis]KAA5292393.1 DUF4468 domain-containing protein [Bacteroides faecis]KAA5299887.1 DUF4468 domain-containing protein [Bacteroides faecis]